MQKWELGCKYKRSCIELGRASTKFTFFTVIMKFEVILFFICVIFMEGSALIANKYDDYDEPKYAYDYSVNDIKTGDAKSQWETNENGIVKGEYSLVEPDGTLRIVEYEADPYFGFRAIVKKTYPSGHQTLDHYG